MRTVYFTLWENVALSPSPTTSSSLQCSPVSTIFELCRHPIQSLYPETLWPCSQMTSREQCLPCYLLTLPISQAEIGKIFQLCYFQLSACPVGYLLQSKLITCVHLRQPSRLCPKFGLNRVKKLIQIHQFTPNIKASCLSVSKVEAMKMKLLPLVIFYPAAQLKHLS